MRTATAMRTACRKSWDASFQQGKKRTVSGSENVLASAVGRLRAVNALTAGPIARSCAVMPDGSVKSAATVTWKVAAIESWFRTAMSSPFPTRRRKIRFPISAENPGIAHNSTAMTPPTTLPGGAAADTDEAVTAGKQTTSMQQRRI